MTLLLERHGAIVSYADPHVASIRLGSREVKGVGEEEAANVDCVVIITDHSSFDYAKLVERAPLIVDSRNALKKFRVTQNRPSISL